MVHPINAPNDQQCLWYASHANVMQMLEACHPEMLPTYTLTQLRRHLCEMVKHSGWRTWVQASGSATDEELAMSKGPSAQGQQHATTMSSCSLSECQQSINKGPRLQLIVMCAMLL